MARQVLPWVGAAVGFFVTGGNPMGAQAGFALGSLIGNTVDPIEVQGNKLGDSPTQTAAEGGARAIVFGKGCIRSTCVLEHGGRRVIKQRDSSGGKGGSPTTVNERALWTYAIGLGEAIPGGAILRIWEDEKLVYDVTPESQIPDDSAAFAQKFRFYDGSEDQLPDPAIEAIYSDPDDAPYYKGTAYVVFPQRDLTDFGERVPTYRFEVATSADVVDEYWEYVGIIGANPSGAAKYQDHWFISCMVPGQIWVGDDEGANFVQLQGVVPDGWQLSSICASPSRLLVRRGYSGALLLENESWSAVTTVNIDAYLVSVWTGERFLCMGHSASAEWSTTGLTGTWINAPIGVSSSVRHALVLGHDVVCAFFGNGQIRRTTNGGSSSWTTPSISGTDPLPFNGFLGAAFDGVTARAYKTVDAGTMVVYTSTDQGASWTVTVESVPLGSYNGGKIGIINSKWTGALGSPVFAPNYPRPFVSEDGISDFSAQDIDGGDSIASALGAEIKIVIDDLDGVGLLVGDRTADGFVVRNRYSRTVVGDPIPLGSAISALHQRCGHTSSDYDVSELTDLVDGIVIEQTVTAAEAINSIIGTHWVDPTEYDGKIRYIKRGKPVVKTLTADDLIDEPETWQRNNAIEYPAKVHFFGQIAESAYAPIKATSSRSSKDIRSHVVGEASISSPETFNDSVRPYEIATIWHKIIWAEAGGEITWRVTDEHMDLVPSDCVGLSWRGQLARARIVQIEDDPGERKLKMKLDRQSAYTANLTEIPVPPAVTPPLTSIPADTALAVLDIPALIDSDDDLHLITAMSGESDAWSGAALQRSTTSGADFETIDSVSNNAIMGVLQEEVAAASPHDPDRTNAVIVELFTSDTIDSLTDEQWLSEGGAFALSWDDGGVQRWEILQYRDAEPLGGNTYRLTNLMRGRLNTEAAAHPVGAMFVLLDTTLRRHSMQSAWIGTDLTHRAVSNGQAPEDADEQTLTYEGNSQREWPVAHVFSQRDANGVLTATTVPRHRFGTEDNPIRSQNWSGYRWEVTDGTNTITREGTSDSEVFDTLNWGDEITVTVWQLNRITGASDPVSTSGETPAPPSGDVLSLRNVWAFELQMSGVAPYGTAFPTKETPATISGTDLLFAFMDSSSEVLPLSGWTLVGEIESDAPSGARRLTVFVKDTVDPANDAGVSFPWETVTDSLANSIGYRAIQTSGDSPGTVADVQSVQTTYSVAQTYPHTINFAPVTSGANGGLLLGFALTGWDGNTSAEGLTYPTGHVVVVVRRLNENDTSSQTAQFQAVRIPPPTPTSGTGYYASISVLLEP